MRSLPDTAFLIKESALTFQNPFGDLYFDLRNQKEELKSGSTKLELKYILSTTPNAEYNMFALILHEEEISVDVMSGKFVLRTVVFLN